MTLFLIFLIFSVCELIYILLVRINYELGHQKLRIIDLIFINCIIKNLLNISMQKINKIKVSDVFDDREASFPNPLEVGSHWTEKLETGNTKMD